jgi:hypothetical protein
LISAESPSTVRPLAGKNGWRRCFDEALDDDAMEPALKEYDLGASGAIDESVVSTDTETFSDHD